MLEETGSGMVSFELLNPNRSACLRRAVAPTLMPRLPKALLQEMEKAWISGGLPFPHVSPASLCSRLPFGSFSAGGAKTADCGLLTFPRDSAVALVTTLKVEPGGNVALMARLSSGCRRSCRYCRSILSSRLPLRVAYRFGL